MPTIAFKKLPDKDFLHTLFRYDNKTGKLYWKVANSNFLKVGQEAGTNHKTNNGFTGYRQIHISGTIYLTHRITWVMHFGDIPDGLEIDHKDRDRTNNRIDNLILVTHAVNMKNSKGKKGIEATSINKASTTKELYIHFCKTHNRFKVIYPKGIYRGGFKSLSEAILRRNEVLQICGRN